MDKAEKLLAKMRASLADWSAQDIEDLYVGFGFRFEEGKAHRKYYHPKYPQLLATVARHTKLAKGYVRTAVRLIHHLKQLEAEHERQSH